jgi:2,3-bisphosphoglycerate-dependent phosphoglycerate mutase
VQLQPQATGRDRTLWLVRHGESTWNVLGLVQGHCPDPVLTRRGRAQAQRAAGQLSGRPVAALYSSDLRRALDTAGPISRAVGREVTVDTRLRERGFGVLEGASSERLDPPVSGIVGGRVVDADAAPPEGESIRRLVDRVAGFLDDLGADGDGDGDGDVVLVVHGGVVRAALAHLDGVEPDDMSWGPVGNGEIFSRQFPVRRARQASLAGATPSTPSAPTPRPQEVRS